MRRRHTITGVLYEKTAGSAGQAEWVPIEIADGDPVPSVRCNVRPLSAEEVQFWGDRGKDTRIVFADTWPFDIHSRLTFEGAEWDQVEPEKNFDFGAATKHHEVVIRKR